MKYETHRRIRITSPFLVLLNLTFLAIVAGVIIPMQILNGKDHLKLEPAHPVRFLSTLPSHIQQQHMAFMRACAARAKASNVSGGCQVLDWIEIVESNGLHDNLFISTFVKEQFQSRTKLQIKYDADEDEKDPNEVYFETRVPEDWRADVALNDNFSFYVVAPEETVIKIEHRLKNSNLFLAEDFYHSNHDGKKKSAHGFADKRKQASASIEAMIGFLLSREECIRLENGDGDKLMEQIFREHEHPDTKRKRRKVFRGGNDTIKVKDLLEAAGITFQSNFDHQCDSDATADSSTSVFDREVFDEIRNTGTHLDVSMYYSNLHGRIPDDSPYNSLFHQRAQWREELSVKQRAIRFVSNALIDVGILPSPHPVYLYCVDAVRPHEGRYFYSSSVPDGNNPRQLKINNNKNDNLLFGTERRNGEETYRPYDGGKDDDDDDDGAKNEITVSKQRDDNQINNNNAKEKEFRKITTHFGIRVKFREAGEFGSFSVLSMLRFLASSVSLLSLPHALVDIIFPFVIEKFARGKKDNDDREAHESKQQYHPTSRSASPNSSQYSSTQQQLQLRGIAATKKRDILGFSEWTVKKPDWWNDYIIET